MKHICMLAAAAMMLSGTIRADDLYNYTRIIHVKSGEEVRVDRHAVFDKRCFKTRDPIITMPEPPKNGTIATRPYTYTITVSLGRGNCNGREIQGLALYYRSNPGFHGTDRVHISADVGRPTPVDVVVTLEVE